MTLLEAEGASMLSKYKLRDNNNSSVYMLQLHMGRFKAEGPDFCKDTDFSITLLTHVLIITLIDQVSMY